MMSRTLRSLGSLSALLTASTLLAPAATHGQFPVSSDQLQVLTVRDPMLDPSGPAVTADDGGRRMKMSPGALWFLFSSAATDLVAGLGEADAATSPHPLGENTYLYDVRRGRTSLVSHRFDDPSTRANGETLPLELTSDGQTFTLYGSSSDMVPGFDGPPRERCDGRGLFCALWLYDETRTEATLITGLFSFDPLTTTPLPVVSDDSRYRFRKVSLFDTEPPTPFGVLVREDRSDGSRQLVSRVEGGSVPELIFTREVAPSPDGSWVVYSSTDAQLAPGVVDDNDADDVYWTDVETGETRLVSHVLGDPGAVAGGSAPMVSADGRYVAFRSNSEELVPDSPVSNHISERSLFLYDLARSRMQLVVSHEAGYSRQELSGDGRFVAFQSRRPPVAGITQDEEDLDNVYLFDGEDGSLRLVSRSPSDRSLAAGGTLESFDADGNAIIWRTPEGLWRYDRIRDENVPLFSDPEIQERSSTFLVDGSLGPAVFLTTVAPLVVGDENETSDIYVAGQLACSGDDGCVGFERFRVTAHWRDADGNTGVGHEIPLTDDTLGFWFFDEENVEVVVKVLDACVPFEEYWIFAAGLTDVEVELTVHDRLSGMVRRYRNELGTEFQPVLGTNGFPTACSFEHEPNVSSTLADLPIPGSQASSREDRRLASHPSRTELAQPGTGACVPSADVLCLQQGRFRVEAQWRSQVIFSQSGPADAVQLTSDTGFFWFFDDDNLEIVVKVLDACDVFGRYWVYAGGLTDVEVDLTVTDTVTGESVTYSNPLGQAFVPVRDTSAFATCNAP